VDDVVDPALDDQHIGVGRSVVEAAYDLGRGLAADAVVAELDPRVAVRRPVEVLALGVVAFEGPTRGIGVVAGVPGGDRVAESGEADSVGRNPVEDTLRQRECTR
jgi:hypothetical protein